MFNLPLNVYFAEKDKVKFYSY